MGLSLIGALSLGVSAATGLVQIQQGRKANKAAREGRAVDTANQKIQNNIERRRRIKEARLQRARINADSNTSGVTGSSGQIGANSALNSNLAFSLSGQSTQVLAAEGITKANQTQSSAITKAKAAGAFGGLLQSGIDFADEENIFRN